MDKKDAKIIVKLYNLLPQERHPHHLAALLELGYYTIYHRLQILVALGYVIKIKSDGGKMFYSATDNAFDKALLVLNPQEPKEDVVPTKNNSD